MLYNVVLVSAVQQSESAIYTHISPLFWISFPFRSPQIIEWGFPGDSDSKESSCNAGDLGLIPGSGRSPGERIGYPLQYSGLENSMDCIVHGVTKSRTGLSDFHFTSLRFTYP